MTYRLSLSDQLRTSVIGPRSRPLRTALSTLGIAVGIAALTALTGVAASNQAQLLAELDDMGANLLVVEPAAGADGRWFDEASRGLPMAVLGATAAERLGVDAAGVRVWIGGQWYAVIGILESAGLAEQIDSAAFLGDEWARAHVSPSDAEPTSAIYVRSQSGGAAELSEAVGNAASPGSSYVDVSQLSDLIDARDSATDALSSLALGLAAIALLVGGIGIANTMVVAVMERRGEIGLRRALGARPGQIGSQFISEAVILAGIGGIVGGLLGALVVFGYALLADSIAVVPVEALVGGPAVAVVVGVVAGLYPALSAARLSPTVALRSA